MGEGSLASGVRWVLEWGMAIWGDEDVKDRS